MTHEPGDLPFFIVLCSSEDCTALPPFFYYRYIDARCRPNLLVGFLFCCKKRYGGHSPNYDDVYGDIGQIAKVMGVTEKGGKLVKDIKSKLQVSRKKWKL
ncbi:hypothetical protein ABES08_22015 [Peribacillus simplex]|uniref:hypothetical protein n=1 Tax=Peribacillus simplex TaxID=1478 RepID=UPI003D280203